MTLSSAQPLIPLQSPFLIPDLTDEKLKNLLDNEQSFQQLADFVPQLMWMANPDGWIYWYNQPWYNYTGLTPAQIEGWGWQQVHDPHTLPAVLDTWKQAILVGESFEMVFPLKGADGVYRHFLTRIVPLKNTAGDVIRWFGSNTDISDQIVLKETLILDASRQQALIDLQQAVAHCTGSDSDIYNLVVDGCLHVIPTATAAAIELIDNQQLVYQAAGGTLKTFVGTRLTAQGSLSGLCLTQGASLVCHDTETDERVDRVTCRRVGVRSMVVLPIIRMGQVIGVLKLASVKPNSFTEKDIAHAQLIVGALTTGFSSMAEATALQAQRDSEALSRFISNNTPVMLWVTDQNHNCTYLNQTWLNYTGQSLEDIQGMGWLQKVHPEDRDSVEKAFLGAAQKQQPFNIDYRLQNRQGEYRWAMDCGAPMIDADGNFLGYTGYVIDITDRKQAEASLIISQKQFRQIVDASIMGIVFATEDGAINDGNDAFLNMIGYTRESLESGHIRWPDLTPPQYAEQDLSKWQDIINTGECAPFEKQFYHRDGHCIDVLIAAALIHTSDTPLCVAYVVDITAQKEAEAALQHSHDRFQAAINAVQGILWTNNAQGEMEGPQPGWANLTGQSYEEYQGYGWSAAVHPDDVQPTVDAWQVAVAEQTNFVFEHRVRRNDGEWRRFSIRAIPILNGDGTLCEWVGVHTDITEQKLAEEALKESKKRLELAFNSGNEGLWDWYDIQNDKVYWNERFSEITGITGEPCFATLYQHLEPQYTNQLTSAIARHMRLHTPFEEEIKLRRPDTQNLLIIKIRGVAEFDSNGHPVRMAGSLTDITENKQAQAALAESEAKFRTLAEAMPQMVWSTQPDGYHDYYNQRWYDFTGATRQETEGQGWLPMFHPDDQALAQQCWQHSLQTGEPYEVEYRLRTADGGYRWVLGRALPMRDDKGYIIRWFGTCTDIEEQVRAREIQARINEELEQRVNDRTAQLQTINKELEAFSYSVSHDLRAPLRSINGFSQALVSAYRDKLDDEARDYLDRIRNNTLKMSRLIDAMLQLSRLSRAEIKKEVINLSQIATNLMQDLQQQDAARYVTVTIHPNVIAYADAGLIQSVLENLLGNAWKYTSLREDACIEFGSTQVNGQTAYYIKDNGAGFDMRYASKLFGAFQRLHAINEFPGTGVGLASVARIIRRHGGDVWATGEVDNGATFFFSLDAIKRVD